MRQNRLGRHPLVIVPSSRGSSGHPARDRLPTWMRN